jgi:hypothetical protein
MNISAKLLVILLLLTPSIFGQVLVDEFGTMVHDDIAGRLYHFSQELKKKPDAKGLIVLNNSGKLLPGELTRRLNGARKYTSQISGISADRLETAVTPAGDDDLFCQLWLIVPGAPRPPVFSVSLSDVIEKKVTIKKVFDKQCVDCDTSPFVSEDILSEYGLDYYAAALKANENCNGLIEIGIVDNISNTAARRKKLTTRILGVLVNKHKLNSKGLSIKFTNSAYATFYIVPKSSK